VVVFNAKAVLSPGYLRGIVTLDSVCDSVSCCHACVTSSNASKDKKVSMGCGRKEVRRGNRAQRKREREGGGRGIPSRYRHPIKGIERSCRAIAATKFLFIYFNQRIEQQHDRAIRNIFTFRCNKQLGHTYMYVFQRKYYRVKCLLRD